MNPRKIMRAILIVLLFCQPGLAVGQAATWTSLRQQLLESMSRQSLKYKYRITTYPGGDDKGRIHEQLNGMLQISGKDYLDSSNVRLATAQKNHYLELDFQGQTATLADYHQLAKKLKINETAKFGINLPDSLIGRYGKIRVDTLRQPGFAVVTIDLKSAEFFLKEIKLTVNRTDLTVASMFYAYTDYSDDSFDNHEYFNYDCLIYDIQRTALPPLPDLNNYIDHPGKNAKLLGKYAGYKLNYIN